MKKYDLMYRNLDGEKYVQKTEFSHLKESLNIISSEANHGNVFKRTKTKNITCKTNHVLFFNQNNLNSILKQITIVVKDIQFHDC